MTTKQREALEAARSFLLKSNCLYPASLRLQIEAALAEPEQELLPIYYMRDDHTFKTLGKSLETAMQQIAHEFDQGYTGGMLCSKRQGFQSVHARGIAHRDAFLDECKKVLLEYLLASPQPREWLELSKTELHNLVRSVYLDYAVYDALVWIRNVYPAISAALRTKNGL